jgi:hypothetical protein
VEGSRLATAVGTNATSGNAYVAAEHVGGTLGATIENATPAEPGETITMFATGPVVDL